MSPRRLPEPPPPRPRASPPPRPRPRAPPPRPQGCWRKQQQRAPSPRGPRSGARHPEAPEGLLHSLPQPRSRRPPLAAQRHGRLRNTPPQATLLGPRLAPSGLELPVLLEVPPGLLGPPEQLLGAAADVDSHQQPRDGRRASRRRLVGLLVEVKAPCILVDRPQSLPEALLCPSNALQCRVHELQPPSTPLPLLLCPHLLRQGRSLLQSQS